MTSIEQKKAVMASVAIHQDARSLLGLPKSVKTYADFEDWVKKNGSQVPRTQQVGFKAIFETHYEEETSGLTKPRAAQITNLPSTATRSPHKTHTRGQQAFRAASSNENTPPRAHSYVNAFGEKVTVQAEAVEKPPTNHPSSTHPSTQSRTRPASYAGGKHPNRARGRQASAAGESFARQLAAKAVNAQSIPQPPDVLNGRNHDDHHHGEHHFSQDSSEFAANVRPCQGRSCRVRGKTQSDLDRTGDSFTRQQLLLGKAKTDQEAKQMAAEGEKFAAYGRTSKSGPILMKKEEDEEEDEL